MQTKKVPKCRDVPTEVCEDVESEDCWTEPEQSCWTEPKEKCWEVSYIGFHRSAHFLYFSRFLMNSAGMSPWINVGRNQWKIAGRWVLEYLSVQLFPHCYFQVSDEECEDIPSERCEAVNVKVARRKCGEQEQSSHGH